MAARIFFERSNGTVKHSIPAMRNRRGDESLDDFVERTAQQAITRDPTLRRLPGNLKTPGKRFRYCWRVNGQEQIMVDMPLARAQRMQEIRAERDARLQAADGPTARETEQNGPDKAAWVAHKQALRDIPAGNILDTITTPEELEAFEPVWPTEPGA